MIRIYLLAAITFSLIGIYSCADGEALKDSSCEQSTLISENLYQDAPTDLLDLTELSIVGDCLELSFGSSGCDGESWVVRLIDSGAILESFPPQRNLILSLDNDEECDAYFVRKYSFDISSLRVEGISVFLNIVNTEYDCPLSYQ